MKDGDAVAADGDRISPDPEIDRREFLEEPDVSVLLSTEIAQDVIIGEIDLLCDAGLRLGLQMASILCRKILVPIRRVEKIRRLKMRPQSG
jgi:hypothetical protein